jgi:hypothetical protein
MRTELAGLQLANAFSIIEGNPANAEGAYRYEC